MTDERTGEDNVLTFVQTVELLAETKTSFFNLYVEDWPWMANRAWRKSVLKKLKNNPLVSVRFSRPNDFDDWTFHVDLKVPPYRQRSLSDPE